MSNIYSLETLREDVKNNSSKLSDYINLIEEFTIENVKKKIKKLSVEDVQNIITILNYYYYYTSSPLTTDAVFETIINLFPQDNIEVCFEDYMNPIKLPTSMPSFKKIYPTDKKKLKTFLDNFLTKEIMITLKLDGLSCLLYNNNGSLQLFTKGTGTEGRNISHFLNKININPEFLEICKKNKNISVRGELIINKKHSEKFKNKPLRNIIVGLINQKKIHNEDFKLIDFVFYFVFNFHNNKNGNYIQQIEFLNNHHAKTTKTLIIDKDIDIEELIQYLTRYYSEQIENYKYDIDGLVLLDPLANYSVKANYIDNILAFKNNIFYANTIVKDIIWCISKDSKYVPRIIIQPCILNKSLIKKIHGYNLNYLKTNRLGIDAEITIKLGGNVIPVLHKVNVPSDNIPLPDTSNIETSIEHIVKNIELFYKTFKIKNFSIKTITKIIEFYLSKKIKIHNIFEYIDAVENTPIDDSSFSNKKINMIQDSIETFHNKTIPFLEFSVALNQFKNLDSISLSQIIQGYPELKNIFISGKGLETVDKEKLKNLPNIGNIRLESFLKGLKYYVDNISLIKKMFKIDYSEIDVEHKLNIYFSNNPNHLQLYDNYYNYLNIYTNIRKKDSLDYIIVRDKDNISEEVKNKAQKYNINIVDNKEFFNIIKKIKK